MTQQNYKQYLLSGIIGFMIAMLSCVIFHGFMFKNPELPTHVILNDWTNGESVSYIAYPEIEDDILVLNEATVTFVEDLKE